MRARLTVDATDWGDVIRLSGARYYAGVDPRGRFGEPSEPEEIGPTERQEMNPITWTMTLRETAEECPLAAPPPGYEPASYSRRDIWRDSGVYHETYQRDNPPTPYSQRRLVDRLHYGFPFGTETIQLNSTGQDYPLCNLPPRVVSALERLEPGASRKNVVDMTPAQRQIVLDDAKAHTLGYLYFLQHDHPKAETRARMRRFALTDEFGTSDRLPPKPYVREGLRLAALYVLREQDVRAPDGAEPGWAPFRPDDAAFSFQFHIDFHPTRRFFDVKGRPDAWHARHCGTRGWNGKTHRAFFPLRALVPEKVDGLLGAGRNVGVSSIVQAAFRLHGQMLLCGAERGRLQHRAGGVPSPRADAPLRTGGRHARRAGPCRGPRAARGGGGSRLRARRPPHARARRGRAPRRRDRRLAGPDAGRSPLRGGQPGAPASRHDQPLLLRPALARWPRRWRSGN